jgi:hypothetical protein
VTDAQGGAGGGVPEQGARAGEEQGPWLECLPKGICESERLASHQRRWAELGAKTGEFMVEREAEHEDEISTDDEED